MENKTTWASVRYHKDGSRKTFYSQEEIDALDPNVWSDTPTTWRNLATQSESEPAAKEGITVASTEKDAGKAVVTAEQGESDAAKELRQCQTCGTMFEPKTFNQKYCSKDCRQSIHS